jgi:dephospho-CoA kinase
MFEKPRKPVIGILGGIGAGKSTVAAELAALGCAVIDGDQLGHEALGEPAVKAELVAAYGRSILLGESGTIDRAALGKIVFDSPAELTRLNALTHPLIRRGIERRIAAVVADPSVRAIVLDAALLLETDWQELCTHWVFVQADDQTRCRRAGAKKGWDRAAWKKREKSQKSLDIKAAKAEYVVDNSSGLSHLREQVRLIFHRIVDSAPCLD